MIAPLETIRHCRRDLVSGRGEIGTGGGGGGPMSIRKLSGDESRELEAGTSARGISRFLFRPNAPHRAEAGDLASAIVDLAKSAADRNA